MRSTPTLTEHARERCIEMGISTKVAKFIVLNASVRRPGRAGSDALIATCDTYPDYAVVYAPEQPPLIITVVFRTTENYVRAGASYVLRKP